MNVLIINNQKYLLGRMKESVSKTDISTHFASNHEEAIEVLNNHSIDIAVLELKTSSDVGLLKYINETFKNIGVILTADDIVRDVVSAIRYGSYSLLSNSFGLSELIGSLSDSHDGIQELNLNS